MNDFQPVLRVLCGLLVLFSLCLALPLGVSLLSHDGLWQDYALALLLGVGLGVIGFWPLHRDRRELQPRHGVLLVTMVWLVLPLFATVPLLLVMRHLHAGISFTHAYFEAVSALTTTGSTVLHGIDRLPLSINVWRTFMQWLGGMGILILAVAILPMLGVGGSQVFKAEVAGPVKDTKLTPRITQTAKGLWSVYVGLSLACFAAYWAGGMGWADALMHMFTTVSLGGLSTHDRSFGYFDSPLLEAIAVLFMLVASCNFALYFVAMRRRSLRGFWRDVEVRATLLTLVIGGLFVTALLWLRGTYAPLEALRHGMFNTISLATTTGFANTDYLLWPVFVPLLMLFLSGLATSAGSTGGGIKMIRVLILVQQGMRELTRLVHPRAIKPVRLGNRIVEPNIIFSVLAFMLFYWATILVLSMLLMLSDLDIITAFSAVIASLHCAGPGLGLVGPASTYAELNDFQLWVCSLAMLLGRLEILSFMVLLMPSFWRR
ncbi:TrkH family potassium uptake protein [Corticibacter populi]|uniref:Trk system potassium uptake protein n=1 Tax=Corticibacter populi TaxID=1550736 RepID=A0A3M6QPB1_9BURK|nr:potassium transporter TrkG [Corticibacter populi]RMX04894.1 TrkH family potassium uptake protein [Corticibacter populi]RZS33683.1 trk system potassium uptake protein TrkH [Corticibacter populi]